MKLTGVDPRWGAATTTSSTGSAISGSTPAGATRSRTTTSGTSAWPRLRTVAETAMLAGSSAGCAGARVRSAFESSRSASLGAGATSRSIAVRLSSSESSSVAPSGSSTATRWLLPERSRLSQRIETATLWRAPSGGSSTSATAVPPPSGSPS